MVSLTLGVPLYGFYYRLRIRRRQWCAWGATAIREIFGFSPNIRTASDAGRRMLKTYLILLCISPRMNVVISRVQAEAWCSLEMAVSSAWGDHSGPVWVGMPYSK